MRSLEIGLSLAGSAVVGLHGAPEAPVPHPQTVQEAPTFASDGQRIDMSYAPDFSPGALSKHAHHEMQDFVKTVDDAKQRFGGHCRIEVTGFASPDDNTSDKAGLDEASPENKRLATDRGQVVAHALRPLLRRHNETLKVVVMPGEEPVLSHHQAATIAHYAYLLNYKSTSDLLQAWRNGTLQDKQPMLSELLREQVGSWTSVKVAVVPTSGADKPTTLPAVPPFGIVPWPKG